MNMDATTDQFIDAEAAQSLSTDVRRDHALAAWIIVRDQRWPGAFTAQLVTITPTPLRAESNAFPLSFAEERLWFLDQVTPGGPTPYTLDGLPHVSSQNGRIASKTRGSTGVVAALSR